MKESLPISKERKLKIPILRTIKKIYRNCYNSSKKGHYKSECSYDKKQKTSGVSTANLVDKISGILAMMSLGTVTDMNMTTPNSSKD